MRPLPLLDRRNFLFGGDGLLFSSSTNLATFSILSSFWAQAAAAAALAAAAAFFFLQPSTAPYSLSQSVVSESDVADQHAAAEAPPGEHMGGEKTSPPWRVNSPPAPT